MSGRSITGGEYVDGRARCQHIDVAMRRPRPPVRVSGVGPCEQRLVFDEPRAVVEHDEGSVRKFGEIRAIDALDAGRCEPIAVKPLVDEISAHRPAVACRPKRTETLVVRIPAFGARPMTGRERRRLVEEEELSPPARRHDDAANPFELQPARDPPLHLRVSDDAAQVVVQDAAISHHVTTPGKGDDFAERRDAVLQRHRGHFARASTLPRHDGDPSVTRCTFATCAQLPDLDPDDRLLAQALEDRGVPVTPGIWNDPDVDWKAADICVVRSTWDYHKQHESFARWVRDVSASTLLLNPAHVMQWNSHKFYLRHLERAGIPIIPTAWLARGTRVDLNDLMEREGWSEAVIKPAYGASADGILRVGGDAVDRKAGDGYLAGLLQTQDALAQPYLASIATHHERALVFIAGEYSHAVTKSPFMHAKSDLSLRALQAPGTSGEIPVQPTSDEIALASRALAASPAGHIYARVDLVTHEDAVRVIEVELIEPTLYLFAHPGADARLADAILTRASC
jgi:glutathione synthase/RimK-type ligase-like ATP-grasp enzyme